MHLNPRSAAVTDSFWWASVFSGCRSLERPGDSSSALWGGLPPSTPARSSPATALPKAVRSWGSQLAHRVPWVPLSLVLTVPILQSQIQSFCKVAACPPEVVWKVSSSRKLFWVSSVHSLPHGGGCCSRTLFMPLEKACQFVLNPISSVVSQLLG